MIVPAPGGSTPEGAGWLNLSGGGNGPRMRALRLKAASERADDGRIVRFTVRKGALIPIFAFAALFARVGASAGVPVAIAALVGAVGCAVSLVVHELGHAVAARRAAGVRPVEILLTWFGAATRLEGAYPSGGVQARVAIAGPEASLTLALALAVWLQVVPFAGDLRLLVVMLACFNLALAVLNLVPVSPLDGYKVLVGLVWLRLGSQAAAARLVGRVAAGWMALELVGALGLAVEKPALGATAMAVAATVLGQKLVAARARR
jgi:Zn-dependent protease